jgi:peptidoglycan/LPS O-acetylase OafA/YrhL
MSSVALPFTLVEASKFRLGHRPALDGIRGLAIIVVVLNHLDHIVPGFLTYFGGGYLGVDLFFVLSGFLITSLLIEEHDEAGRVNLKRFYMRRALRLFPAVAAALVVAVITGLVLGFDTIGMSGWRFASIIGYFTNWVRAFESGDIWFLSHFWSLAIEEQFYLVWPVFLIGLLSLPRKAALLIVAALASASAMLVVSMFLSDVSSQRIYTGSDTRAYQLLAGCFLSMLVHWNHVPAWFNEERRTRLAPVFALGLCVMFLRAQNAFPVMYLGGYVLATICAAVMILHVTLDRSRLSDLFENRILVWLGKRSYGLYVWHFPLYFLISRLNKPWLAPIAVGLAVVATWISYRFIESPFLRIKARFKSQAA